MATPASKDRRSPKSSVASATPGGDAPTQSGTDRRRSPFPPIADYGFLSDCENSCLVAPDGAVEWLCLPRPDSPSVFGALLDRTAGLFRVSPTSTQVPHQRRYIPGTMVLETTWHTPTGWLVVQDLLVVRPVQTEARRADYVRAPGDTAATGTLLRLATCIGGRVEVVVNAVPIFEYGGATGIWDYDGEGYGTMTVHPPAGDPVLTLTSSIRLGVTAARCYGRSTLDTTQSAFVALSWGDGAPTSVEEAQAQLVDTISHWRNWLSTGKFPDHPWRSYMERSALTLKGLSYAPTGAIMAAATTSLPETPGGARNWDYRYTWIRDSSFMLRSLYRLGFEWEAIEYFAFIIEAVAGRPATAAAANAPDADWELQIMYGIGGEKDLTEHTLDHLTGYRDSRPVRIGNGAWDQHQNDVWGMLLDAVNTYISQGAAQIAHHTWQGVASLVEQAIKHAGDPDQGIWEIRGEPQYFTASKALCWVAIDRGSDLAADRRDDDRAQRWRQAADALKAEILEKGVDNRGRFRQHYGNEELDASLLLIPILGFLPPDDERVRNTVLAIADELTEDGLVLRYKVDTTDTGFEGKEGTFTICSFWLVTALAMIGERDRAMALCQKLLSFAGPLQLYAEEIDATTGEHLGNFPQAFTHLALIDALGRLIESEQESDAFL
jgi:alpha,alpha-trehalase